MVYILTDKYVINLYEGNDETYSNLKPLTRWRVNRLFKKVIETLYINRCTRLVCDTDSIGYGLKLASYFLSPITIVYDKYQYLSTSEFWSDYVRFK